MCIYIWYRYKIIYSICIFIYIINIVFYWKYKFLKIEYIILSRTCWEEYYHGKSHTWTMLRSLKYLELKFPRMKYSCGKIWEQ